MRTPRYYPNKFPGLCEVCGRIVRPREGRVRRRGNREWITSHPAREWYGSPASGRWDGGCPQRTATDTEPPEQPASDAAAARLVLYATFYGDGEPPHTPAADPDEQARDDAAVVELAALAPLALWRDDLTRALLTTLARRHHWTGTG